MIFIVVAATDRESLGQIYLLINHVMRKTVFQKPFNGQNMIPLLLILLLAKIAIAQDNIGKSQLGLQPSLNSPEYVNNTVFEYNYHDHGQVPISSYIHQYISKLKPMPNILKAWTGSSTYNDQVESQFYPGEILVQQPLGLGPRRRKRSALNAPKIITKAIEHLLEMPLFCWKIYVNCLVFPNHICCPIQKKKPRRTRRNFDIPMSVPKEDLTRRSDEYQTSHEFQRQEWKPYSPYYIGLQGYKKPTGKVLILTGIPILHTIRKVKFLSKNSILTKSQHFHEFFHPNFFYHFSREIKVVNS